MMTLATIWLVLASVLTLVWLRRHGDVSRAHTTIPAIGGESAPASSDDEHWPKVSVVLAAKDEESGVAACVESLLGQSYPDFEMIAVDDRSGDGTGAILASLAAGDASGRLRVVTIELLPEGWFGKTHAVHRGAQLADGEFLLFTDADCVFTSPHALAAAVGRAQSGKIDLLSVIPKVQVSCAAEAVVQPVASAILMLWHHPHLVNDPGRRVAYANGAFMLFRRSAYEAIGGHARVKSLLCEDMWLARIVKGSGLRLFVTQNVDLYETRMYENFGETWRGWTRIFQGGLHSPVKILLAMVVLVVFSLGPWASLIGVIVTGVGGGWGWPINAILAASVAAVGAQQSVTLRLYPLMGRPRIQALLYPLGALVSVGILVSALLKSLGVGRTRWQGTSYRGSDLGVGSEERDVGSESRKSERTGSTPVRDAGR